MCGIAGIISKGSIDKNSIEQMTSCVSHRGPDGYGYYLDDRFALGHRRLAILDLSDAGHQPMEYMQRYIITYNGEIYNYIEIRKELEKEGYTFQSKTDTEVIMAAYSFWGSDCVNHFNGMWAFALFDKEKKIFFLSRDRFGVKPLYYAQIGDMFVFGSEIKQLLLFSENRFVNKKILIDYLVCGFSEHTEETFFEGIYSLAGGHNLTYCLQKHTFCIEKFYHLVLDKTAEKIEEEQAIEKYKEEFLRSIRFRLRSDVKVGTCLSGGLDSSSVAATASDQYYLESRLKFQAIHAKSTEIETQESDYAEKLASEKPIELHILTPSVEDFLAAIDDVFYTQEEPFGSPSVFMQFFVMKKAREIGSIVMLDGQGGDETLLGYERYYPAYLFSLPFWKRIKGFLQSKKNSRLSFKELFGYCIYFTFPYIRIKALKKRFSFIKSEFLNHFEWIKKNAASYFNINSLQELEIFHTQLPHLLRYEDKNSMRHSIETRLPFLDYRLLETALSLPSSYKIQNGWTKYILRKSMQKIVPYDILWRKNKLGFNAPENTWIDAIKDNMIQEIGNSRLIQNISKDTFSLKKLDKKTLWRLYSIAKWENIYNVNFSSI